MLLITTYAQYSMFWTYRTFKEKLILSACFESGCLTLMMNSGTLAAPYKTNAHIEDQWAWLRWVRQHTFHAFGGGHSMKSCSYIDLSAVISNCCSSSVVSIALRKWCCSAFLRKKAEFGMRRNEWEALEPPVWGICSVSQRNLKPPWKFCCRGRTKDVGGGRIDVQGWT